MRRSSFKFTIWRLMAIVSLLALVLATLRHAVRYWGPGEITTLAWAVLVVTNVLAWFQRDRWQIFWVGFGLTGWAFLTLSIGSSAAEYLPTTRLLDGLHDRLYATPASPNFDDDFDGVNTGLSNGDQVRRAGHSLIGLCFALLGGVGACTLFPKRGEDRDGLPVPDGSLLDEGWRDERIRRPR
jgi:hypothetical protein